MKNDLQAGLQSIIDAINNLIEPKLSSLKYDKTYRARIISNEGNNTYGVQINGKFYKAVYTGEQLSVGQMVKVKAPLNNFSDIYIETLPGSGSGEAGNYNDLLNKPILNTNNTGTQVPSATETIQGTISLHKVSKTGNYNDLLNKPTLDFIPTSEKGAANGVASLDENGKVVKSDLPTDTVYDSNYVHTDNNFTTAMKDKLDSVAEGAEPNIIDIVQKNGKALPVTNKTVNIEVPIKTSDLTNDGDGTTGSEYITNTDLNAELENKQDKITGGATTIVADDLTVNRALVSNANGKVAISNTTSTELGYLVGTRSNLQTQIDSITTSGGQPNVIEVVQENGVPLEVVNKTVNVTVPTKNSELENDKGYITSIPIASSTTLGGIKVGQNLEIENDGTLNAVGGGTSVTVVDDLSSTSSTDALSANQGRVLNEKFNNYLPLAGGTMSGDIKFNDYYSGIYWKEPGFGDQFKIVPQFSGSDDDNYLSIRGAVGDAGTLPSLYDLVNITGKSGNVYAKGNMYVDRTNGDKIVLNEQTGSHAGTPSESNFEAVGVGQSLYRSGLYSYYSGGNWYNLINVRHRNGADDGVAHGMQIVSVFGLRPSLRVRQQSAYSWGDWYNIPSFVSLYDNDAGTNGNITLSEDAANFNMLEIFYRDNTGVGNKSTRVYNPNGRWYDLSNIEPSGESTVIRRTEYGINGTTMWIRNNDRGYVNIQANGNFVNVDNSYIFIYKIIGWR